MVRKMSLFILKLDSKLNWILSYHLYQVRFHFSQVVHLGTYLNSPRKCLSKQNEKKKKMFWAHFDKTACQCCNYKMEMISRKICRAMALWFSLFQSLIQRTLDMSKEGTSFVVRMTRKVAISSYVKNELIFLDIDFTSGPVQLCSISF